MALTKVSLVDLNAGELILDLDADTSITSDTDDTIHFKIGGSDEITITGTALSPSTSDGNALGTSALEWSDLFLADGAVINFGDDQDVSLTHVADTGLLLSSTDQLQFGDSGTYIHQSADGVLDLVSDTEIEINATTIDMNGALDVSGTITSGGVITGTAFTAGSAVITEAELETLDGVTVGTAIASKVVTTDANIDTTGQRNLTISGELDAATGDFSGDVDIDGTANLDTVDIDGATQIDATVTVGVDDTGYDVKFFGDTSGANVHWDASEDDLSLAGAARLVVPEGNLVLGSTAVTSTAAELNLIDGGASTGTTAVADADGILTNDGGTMRLTTAATFKTYFQEGISTAYDDLTIGDAAVLITTSSGDITIDAAADNSDIILKGTDGGADTTFLTIDGSAAGAATFNSTVTATGFIIGSANINEAELEIIDGATITTTELNLIDGGATVGTTAVADGDGILHNDAGTMRVTSAATFKTYFQAGLSSAADDLEAGDAAVLITTSSGNITIDAAADDSDIILKGTDGGADTTFLTIDGSAAGEATFNAGVIGTSFNSIPFYSGDTSSIYTTDVSGTDDTASGNSAYGYQAMDAITTGDNNTAMGFDAMGANTTGAANVSVGKDALKANTTASYNIAVGFEAMAANTTGTRNLAIGNAAYDCF